MEQIVTVIHILIALALVGFILLQQGKGAEAGASFGAGASQTIFGSQGTGSILTRITAMLATGFFITSLILGYFALHRNQPTSIDQLINKAKETSTQHSGGMTDIPGDEVSSKNTGLSSEAAKNKHKTAPSAVDHDIPKLPVNQMPDNLKTDNAE